jgi:hypothetical protein
VNILHIYSRICKSVFMKIYLIFVVPYILVHILVCLIQVQLDVHHILYFFLDSVSSICFGCYLHPSSGAQLQRTAIGFVWFGVLLHWSRYWFWDSFTLEHGQLHVELMLSINK